MSDIANAMDGVKDTVGIRVIHNGNKLAASVVSKRSGNFAGIIMPLSEEDGIVRTLPAWAIGSVE
jgi:hypothetical protein